MAIVVITLALHPHDYVASGHCWLNVHTDAIWAFVGPVLFVLTVSWEVWVPRVGGGHVGKRGFLLPTGTQLPGQYLHLGPCGHGHCIQHPPPCTHAEPTAWPTGEDQVPDMVRLS